MLSLLDLPIERVAIEAELDGVVAKLDEIRERELPGVLVEDRELIALVVQLFLSSGPKRGEDVRIDRRSRALAHRTFDLRAEHPVAAVDARSDLVGDRVARDPLTDLARAEVALDLADALFGLVGDANEIELGELLHDVGDAGCAMKAARIVRVELSVDQLLRGVDDVFW